MLQSTGLLFGARGEIVVALRDFGACIGHAFGTLAHCGHEVNEIFLHVAQGAQQVADLIVAAGHDAVGEVAMGHLVCDIRCVNQGPHNLAAQPDRTRQRGGTYQKHHK